MTEQDLREIEAREMATPPGPWEHVGFGDIRGSSPQRAELIGVEQKPQVLLATGIAGEEDGQRVARAEFAAHARSDVPALVAEVRRLSQLLLQMSRDWNMTLAAIVLQAGGKVIVRDEEIVLLSDAYEVKTTFNRGDRSRIIEVICPEPTAPTPGANSDHA